MASKYDQAIVLLNARKARLLNYAQLVSPEDKFKLVRTMILDELGQNGFEKELKTLLDEGNHPTNQRNGQEHIVHERGCHDD